MGYSLPLQSPGGNLGGDWADSTCLYFTTLGTKSEAGVTRCFCWTCLYLPLLAPTKTNSLAGGNLPSGFAGGARRGVSNASPCYIRGFRNAQGEAAGEAWGVTTIPPSSTTATSPGNRPPPLIPCFVRHFPYADVTLVRQANPPLHRRYVRGGASEAPNWCPDAPDLTRPAVTLLGSPQFSQDSRLFQEEEKINVRISVG